MGKKIFVSYKYADSNVQALPGRMWTTVRNYVDKLDEYLGADDHIFKGEDDGEDMSTLSDTTISTKLGDRIFDSSITIVLISKGMKNPVALEKDQWMPWEISYSLREQSRAGRSSKTNGVLAVVLPDIFGSYDYYIKENTCPNCNCRILSTNFLFKILGDNMFNIRNPEYSNCSNHQQNTIFIGYSSYIHTVKWSDFIADLNTYIDIAEHIKDNIDSYYIQKTLS